MENKELTKKQELEEQIEMMKYEGLEEWLFAIAIVLAGLGLLASLLLLSKLFRFLG